MNFKALVEAMARKMGYSVIPTWREDSYPAAKYLKLLFAFLDIDCVIDVGANIGQYRDFLRDQVDYRGTIVSFEPLPPLVERLETRALQDQKWVIDSHALGASAGHREDFNEMTSNTFSSFLSPSHDELELFRGSNDVQGRVNVDIETLDRIMPALRSRTGARNFYLKMDTQGYDLEVLRGAAASLKDFKALQSETSVRQIYEGMPLYDDVIRYCEAKGFLISAILPNNQGHFPILVDFDCYFINGDCLAAKRGQVPTTEPSSLNAIYRCGT